MAESQYAVSTYSLTLTYAPQEEAEWIDGIDQAESQLGEGASYQAKQSALATIGELKGELRRIRKVDPKNAICLAYDDVILMNKRLRKAGYAFKMLCQGEYGGKTSRAHWHMILWYLNPDEQAQGRFARKFWKTGQHGPVDSLQRLGLLPTQLEAAKQARAIKRKRPRTPRNDLLKPWLPIKKFHHWEFWPHGHVCVREGSGPAVGYVVKYLDKGSDPDKEKVPLRMSKTPAIGEQLFIDRAKKYVEAGLAPQNGLYTVPGSYVHNGRGESTGTLWNYRMFGASKRTFVRTFLDEWAATYPGREVPASTWLDKATWDYEHWQQLKFDRTAEGVAAEIERAFDLKARLRQAKADERDKLRQREREKDGSVWPSERDAPPHRPDRRDYVVVDDAAVIAAKAKLAAGVREAQRAAALDAERWRLAGDYPALVGIADPNVRQPAKPVGRAAIRAAVAALAAKSVRRPKPYAPLESGAYPLARLSGAIGGIGRPLRDETLGEKHERAKAVRPVRDAQGRRIFYDARGQVIAR